MKTPPFQAVFFLHEDPPENGHCEGEVCSGYPLQNARVTAQIAPVALKIRESFSRSARALLLPPCCLAIIGHPARPNSPTDFSVSCNPDSGRIIKFCPKSLRPRNSTLK